MESQEKRIIEIDGIKLEIDLRQAKRIEHYKVGDNVKVLKKSYGGKYDVYPGVILGFTEFASTPTIEIAYLELGYKSAEVHFVAINDKVEDDRKVEIAPLFDGHDLNFKKADVVKALNSEIQASEEATKDLQRKKRYFEEYFAKYFDKRKESIK
jgi:hypothetical protein